jgi:hypothetical protein
MDSKYTAKLVEQYENAQNISELYNFLANAIINISIVIINYLGFFKKKSLYQKLSDYFKSSNNDEDIIIHVLITRCVAIIINSLRFIFHQKLNKNIADDLVYHIIKFCGFNLASRIDPYFQSKTDVAGDIVKSFFDECNAYNFPLNDKSHENDFAYLVQEYPKKINKTEKIAASFLLIEFLVILSPNIFLENFNILYEHYE